MPTFDFPGRPPKDVLDFFTEKKVMPSWSWKDVWQHEHDTAFAVAKALDVDLLKDIQAAVTNAIETGQTFRAFQKELFPKLETRGWVGVDEDGNVLGTPRRLKTIFDTNIRQARAAGFWDRIQETKESHPYLEYLLGPSARHRPIHVSWSGTLLPVDDPWWETHFPVIAWGCKCWVRQVSEVAKERTGKQVSKRPDNGFDEWQNETTGELIKVPKGVDPAFAYPVGRSRASASAGLLARKAQQLPTDRASAVFKDNRTVFNGLLEKEWEGFAQDIKAEKAFRAAPPPTIFTDILVQRLKKAELPFHPVPFVTHETLKAMAPVVDLEGVYGLLKRSTPSVVGKKIIATVDGLEWVFEQSGALWELASIATL